MFSPRIRTPVVACFTIPEAYTRTLYLFPDKKNPYILLDERYYTQFFMLS